MFNKWGISFTKKIGFVLFFLIIYSSGFYLIQKQAELVICKYQFKNSILKDISEKKLIAFKVSKDFDADEFEVDDIWYDVVKSKALQDFKIVYCIEDSNESEIHKELSRYAENWYRNGLNDFPNQLSFYKFLLDSKYINTHTSLDFYNVFLHFSKQIFPTLISELLYHLESKFKPPIIFLLK